VTRERLARAALVAYPAPLRAARGHEMVDTLLDASEASRWRFVSEIVALVRAGAQARAIESARAGALRATSDACCLSAVWVLALFACSDLGDRIRGDGWSVSNTWPHVLGLIALCLALVGYDRGAGAATLLFAAGIASHMASFGDHVMLIVLLVSAGALLLAPRRRRPDLHRLAWLVAVGAVALAASTGDDTTAAPVILGVLILLPAALAMLPANPRPAIACVLPAIAFGTTLLHKSDDLTVPGIAFLAAAGLLLATSLARIRAVRGQTVI
jgi:hypothetical protein